MARDYVKLYTCILDDPDINDLSPMSGWIWARMLALAGRREDRGRIGEPREIAYVLRVTTADVAQAVTDLAGRVHEHDGQLYFRDWAEWQTASNRERQADFRAARGNEVSHAVTDSNGSNAASPTCARAQMRPDQTKREETIPDQDQLRCAADAAPPATTNGSGPAHSRAELQNTMFAAVCAASGKDTALLNMADQANAGKLASWLVKAGWDADDVRRAGEEWARKFPNRREADIRPPTLAQLRTWLGECEVRWRAESVYDDAVLR